MKAIEIKGKSGQTRENGKKAGGVVYSLVIPQEEAEAIFAGILKRSPGKLSQMLFSYGLTSKAQEAVGYVIPGSVKWEDEKTSAPQRAWTSADTEAYFAAVDAFESMERAAATGFNTVELRGFYRALHMAGMDYDTVRGMAIAKGIKHASDDALSDKVWSVVTSEV